MAIDALVRSRERSEGAEQDKSSLDETRRAALPTNDDHVSVIDLRRGCNLVATTLEVVASRSHSTAVTRSTPRFLGSPCTPLSEEENRAQRDLRCYT